MAKRQSVDKKFVIVAFQDDCDEKTGAASMEVIPSCWLCGSEEAWWPNIGSMKRVGEMIRKCTPPNESSWEKFRVRVLGYSGECMLWYHCSVKFEQFTGIGVNCKGCFLMTCAI